MKSSWVIILVSSLLSFSLKASADLSCSEAHRSSEIAASLLNHYLTADDFNLMKPAIQKLAQRLLLENSDAIMTSQYGIRTLFEYNIRKAEMDSIELQPSPHGAYKIVSVHLINEWKEKIEIKMRTNGKVAFLDRSFLYRDPQKAKSYRVVYQKGRKLEVADQGEIILKSLPEKVQLSRVLSLKERDVWLENQEFVSGFGHKLHFALNHYRFQNKEPYHFTFDRDWLLQAYRNGQIEINTYESKGPLAPSSLGRTPFGLEIEIVFVGKEVLSSIQSKMREDLRQGILAF